MLFPKCSVLFVVLWFGAVAGLQVDPGSGEPETYTDEGTRHEEAETEEADGSDAILRPEKWNSEQFSSIGSSVETPYGNHANHLSLNASASDLVKVSALNSVRQVLLRVIAYQEQKLLHQPGRNIRTRTPSSGRRGKQTTRRAGRRQTRDIFSDIGDTFQQVVVEGISELVTDAVQKVAKEAFGSSLRKKNHKRHRRAGLRTQIVDTVEPPHVLLDMEEFNMEDLLILVGDESTLGRRRTVEFLATHGLLANRLCCPCGEKSSLQRDVSAIDRYVWRCSACRRNTATLSGESSNRVSIRNASFFSQSKLSLKQIILITYYWAGHPTSKLDQIATETRIAKRTIVDFYNFLRDLCQQWAFDHSKDRLLGGQDVIVEVDESKFFRAKHNRGRKLGKESGWVFGLTERGTNEVRLFEVQNRSADTLLPLIASACRPGTIVVSDGWKAYGGIEKLSKQMKHGWVNHRYNFVNPEDPLIHTQSIEATWGSIKRSMKHLSGTSQALFRTYLFNYQFRRYHGNQKIFQHILSEMRRQYVFHDDC